MYTNLKSNAWNDLFFPFAATCTLSERRKSMENHTVYARSADVQVTAKLTIKDFVEVMKTSKPGKCYASDTFMVGATPMAIKVYPNGSKDKYKGNVAEPE